MMHPPYIALYPSDFLADITTLGNTELGIYWRLLLVYYQSRRPLPQDRDKLIRTAMASSPEEIRALDVVIEQFFLPGTYGEDNVRVYRHARADKEIAAATSRWEAAHGRAVKAAKARWDAQAMLEHSLSNANQNLKKQGSSSTRGGSSKISKSFTDLLAPSACALEAPASPTVISIPLNNKTEYPVTQAMIDEWVSLYPDCDVLQTLREIRGWGIANPTKRKTRAGVMTHINRWLAKEHNRG